MKHILDHHAIRAFYHQLDVVAERASGDPGARFLTLCFDVEVFERVRESLLYLRELAIDEGGY